MPRGGQNTKSQFKHRLWLMKACKQAQMELQSSARTVQVQCNYLGVPPYWRPIFSSCSLGTPTQRWATTEAPLPPSAE